MAIVRLQRAWYRPKQPVIHYVVSQRVLVRARPSRVRNPRTKAQQANRSKMAIASRFLSQLQEFVMQGFQAGERPNGRPVGAYHVALGHLLSNAMRREDGQWRIDYANVQLAEGLSIREYPVRVKRNGRTLRLAWLEGLPEGTQRIRLAFHNAKRGETQCCVVKAPKKGAVIEVLLPKWAKAGSLHMWWSPVVSGKARWGSGYLFLSEAIVVVVGWALMRRRVAAYGVNQPEGSRGAWDSRVVSWQSARAPAGGSLPSVANLLPLPERDAGGGEDWLDRVYTVEKGYRDE